MANKIIDCVMRLQDRFSPALKNINEKIIETHKQTERAGKSVSKFGKTFKSVGEHIALATAPVVGFGVACVKAFGDFEEAANKVQVKFDKDDWLNMSKINNQALELSTHYQQSVGAIQAVQEQLASAGMNTTQVLQATQAVLNGVDATGADATIVASLAANSLNAFGLEASDLNHVMDMLVVTANQTNTGIEEMAESYKYCSSAASALKVDMADVSTAIGLMSNGGLKGSEAGTAVKDMLERMTDPAHREHLEKIGVKVQDLNGHFVGMASLLDQCREKMSKMTDMQKMDIIKQAFGSTALPGVVTLLNQSSESWNTLNKQIRDSDGVAEEAAKVLNSGLNAQFKILKNNIIATGIIIGGKLKGQLTSAINLFSNLFTKIKAMNPDTLAFIVKVAALIAIFGTLVTIGGTIIIFFGSVITTLASASAAVASAGGAIGILSKMFNVLSVSIRGIGLALKSMFLSPIGLVILAVAALAFGIYMLYTKCETFRTVVNTVFKHMYNTAVPIMNKLVSTFKTLWAKIVTTFTFANNAIKRIWNSFHVTGETATKILSFVLNNLGAVVEVVFDLMCIVISNFVNSFGNFIDGIITVANGLIMFVEGVFFGRWDEAWNGIKNICTGIFDIVTNSFNGMINTLSAGLDYIIGKSDTAKSAASSANDSGDSGDSEEPEQHWSGASWFHGGATLINEKGPELVKLPTGAQIVPHSESLKQEYARGVANASKNASAGISITVPKIADTIVVRDETDIDKIANQLVFKLKSFAINNEVGAI